MTREIVDESDVYVDVHKAIRRLTPAPRARRIEAAAAAVAKKATESPVLVNIAEGGDGSNVQVGSLGAQSDGGGRENRPRTAIFMKRQSSADPDGVMMHGQPEPMRGSLQDVKTQLRLGPANRAARPLHTRQEVFKTKQGLVGPSSSMPRSISADGLDAGKITTSSERTPLLQHDSEHGTK